MKRVLYSLYERRLRRQIHARPTPRHVGIILDGNRRFAREHGLVDPRAAYDLGAEKLDDVLSWCSELKIPAVTLWVCSIDNLKRPQAEVCSILAGQATGSIQDKGQGAAAAREHIVMWRWERAEPRKSASLDAAAT